MLIDFIRKYGFKKIVLSINDIICSITAALLILFLTTNDFWTYIYGPQQEKFLIFIFGSFLIVPIFRYYQLYKHKYFLKAGEQSLLILKGLLIQNIIIILIIFILKTQESLHDSRTQVIFFFFTSFILLFFTRIFIFRYTFRSSNLGDNLNKFLLRRSIAIGAGGLGHFFADTIVKKQYYSINLVGFIDDDTTKANMIINGIPVLGMTSDIGKVVINEDIDEIYITIQKIDYKKLLDLIEKCKLTNCQINLVSNHFDIINRKWDANEYFDLKLIPISSKASPLYSEKFKRMFDIVASSLLIFLTAPISFTIGLLIKLSTRGPVFYKTTVVGKNGKRFKWYKFRTMYFNNDPSVHKEHLKKVIIENNAYQKLINDSRITKIGKILRKFSLDELPQLINVFIGDMSLVGPRPCLLYEYEIFQDWHKLRYKVIPGMTGLAQILARNRKDISFNDSILLDLFYADNQSLWLDLKIMFKTIPVILLGRGGI